MGDQEEGFFFEGINRLEQHWKKITLKNNGTFPKYRGRECFDRPS